MHLPEFVHGCRVSMAPYEITQTCQVVFGVVASMRETLLIKKKRRMTIRCRVTPECVQRGRFARAVSAGERKEEWPLGQFFSNVLLLVGKMARGNRNPGIGRLVFSLGVRISFPSDILLSCHCDLKFRFGSGVGICVKEALLVKSPLRPR